MAEIDDAQLAELKKAHSLLQALYADSGVGFDFRKLVKRKFPNASMPELAGVEKAEEVGALVTKQVEELGTNLTKKIDGFLEERKKEREEADVDAFRQRINTIVKERGYTKEGEEKLLGLMKERGIQNPEDAAIIFESTQPKPVVKQRGFSSRMPFISPSGEKDELFDKLMGDPDQYMMDEMTAALNGTEVEE